MHKVKLLFGILYSDIRVLEKFLKRFESIWGTVDYRSEEFLFTETSYYENEMGKNIHRVFISFTTLVSADEIAEIKHQTILLESEGKINSGRQINIDPGYLDLDKLVLASTKYGRQKIYIGKSMWADPILHYFKKSYQFYDWSFPDFKSDKYFLNLYKIRELYKKQLKDIE